MAFCIVILNPDSWILSLGLSPLERKQAGDAALNPFDFPNAGCWLTG